MKSISVKINTLNFIFLSLSILIITLMVTRILYNQELENILSLSKLSSIELGKRAERLLDLGLSVSDFYGFEEQCDDVLGDETYFSGVILYDSTGEIHSSSKRVPETYLDRELLLTYVETESVIRGKFWVSVYPIVRDSTVQAYAVIYINNHYFSKQIISIMRLFFILILGISIVSLSIQKIFMKHLIGKPLNGLVAVADSIDPRNMDFSDILREKQRKDDIGRIYLALYNLMIRLRDVNEELIEQNRSLDAIVQDRTKELEIANVMLEEDIRRQKELEEQLRHTATTDKLTGLPNRASLQNWTGKTLGQAKRNSWKVAFLFIDLDNFKTINDTYGHEYGDLVLLEVGRRLLNTVRQSDVVIRLGGDEFLSILSNIDNSLNAGKVARKINLALKKIMEIQGNEFKVGSSIGISIYPDEGLTVDELLTQADLAMYHAKEKGRNNFQFFNDDLLEKAQKRFRLEKELLQALEDQEFITYFQPVVRSRDLKIIGFEALVRWDKGDGDIRTPDYFLSVAEETGLIDLIGAEVLRQSCKQMVQWLEEGFSLERISVNISPRQLSSGDLPDIINKILEETGLSPSMLELEIIESTLMDRGSKVTTSLEYFKEKGIKVAIDDFGTGYSSLSYLQFLSVDHLKIDQEFLRDGKEKRNREIISTIINLATSLNMSVVCEGVETKEQCEFLKKMDCDELQGYYFSRPMPDYEVSSWLSEWKPFPKTST